MKELKELELREIDAGCPWLGFGLINEWLVINAVEFCHGVADGWNANTPK